MNVILLKVNHNLLIWNDLPNRISRIYSSYDDDNFFRLKAKYLALHFKKLNGRLPVLWVWGTGRLVNRNSSYLLAEGFTIEKYIDIKPVHALNHIYYKDIPLPGTVVIVSYVRDRKGKTEIASYLTARAYTEGIDFFLMT